jgi:hypothetical protein
MIHRLAVFMARRKAWQIFVALVAPMLLAQFYIAAAIPAPSGAGPAPDVAALEQLSRRMLMVGLVMFLLFLSWLVSIGWVSNQQVSAVLRPTIRWFFAAAVYAIAYFAFASYFLPSSLSTGGDLPWMIFAMHLLAMVAVFYVLGFSAKNLIMSERQSPVSFFDYSGPFFLLWFFPIGVWFVQPRVNRLVAAT